MTYRRHARRKGRIVAREYMAWMHRSFGCLVAMKGFGGCRGPLTFHHVKECPGAPKNDFCGLILCAAHHLYDWGPCSIERLGPHRWEAKFGIDRFAEIRRCNELWQRDNPGKPVSTADAIDR